MKERAELVINANALRATSSRPGAPRLSEDSSRERLCEWLQWCDPNGCHTDDLARANGFDPYDTARAWEAIADMLEDS